MENILRHKTTFKKSNRSKKYTVLQPQYKQVFATTYSHINNKHLNDCFTLVNLQDSKCYHMLVTHAGEKSTAIKTVSVTFV